jgi:hypothetical protein
VEPLAALNIAGTGFNPSADLKVRFIIDDNFSFEVPVLEATSTSIIVAVPPYLDPTSGQFGSGTVSVQVVQNTSGNTIVSNTFDGLQIAALPDLTFSPGEVTGNVAAFLELSLTDTIDRLAELETLPRSQISTQDLRDQLEALKLEYGQLKDKVQKAVLNPDQADMIGTINGISLSLDQQSLETADKLMIAVINATLAQLQATAAASVQSEALSAARAEQDFATFCAENAEQCTAAGVPLLTVLDPRTGSETPVERYEYAITLPGASKVLNKMMNWFAAATATIGAVVAAEFTVPIAVTAALTEINVTCMSIKYGIDAARLSANNDDIDAAKDLRDDFNSTAAYLGDSVLTPTIGAISEKAGTAYDLFEGWLPVVEGDVPYLVSDLNALSDSQTSTGDVTGSWYGSITNPYLGADCAGGVSYFSIDLNEDANQIVSGSYGSVSVSGSRNGYVLSISASTRFGTRNYTWTWDGSDTITGSVAYFCWSNDTGALLSEGSGTFSVARW